MHAITCRIGSVKYVLTDAAGGMVIVDNFVAFAREYAGLWFSADRMPRRGRVGGYGVETAGCTDSEALTSQLPGGYAALQPFDAAWILTTEETNTPEDLELMHRDRKLRIPMRVSGEVRARMEQRLAYPPNFRPSLTMLLGEPLAGSSDWWKQRGFGEEAGEGLQDASI